MTTRQPSRRQVLELALVAGTGASLSFSQVPPARPDPSRRLEEFLPAVRHVRDRYLARAAGWVDAGVEKLVRPDGFVYAVDVAQLMHCFAEAKDRARYDGLRAHAADHLVTDNPSDPFTRGFVLWRHRPAGANAGAAPAPDASGTTEALRLARALWLGAGAFDRPADRDLALTVLRGYARHETVDQGVWMIRNYFGFGTRSFASNSYLVDYDPDFGKEVADATADEELGAVAEKSYALVGGAHTPAGLLYDLVQPELKTMYPLLAEKVVTFSPNDVVQLSNAGTVALTVALGLPAVARRVLDFALTRLAQEPPSLRTYHYGRTGEPVDETQPGINEWSTLTRLAARLSDRPAAAALIAKALPHWDYYLDHVPPTQPDAFVASEAIAATTAVLSLPG